MKMLTKAIVDKFISVGAQDSIRDKMVVAKYFDPCGSLTWYATEMYIVLPDGGYRLIGNNTRGKIDNSEIVFFGLVVGQETELGYFSLNEMMRVKNRFGLGIERDRYFTPQRFSDITDHAVVEWYQSRMVSHAIL